MTMQAVWTIEVGGSSRKYSNMNFERKLDRKTPTTFKAKIEYASPAVAFFNLVEIKRNGTTEWKGYVETIEIEWDDSGRWYNVTGRDTAVILWKKHGEEFQQYADGIEGFFGKVSASELIKFILRTPRSDLPSEKADYQYNKMGWGLDASRIMDVSAARTSYGDPKWTTLRKRSVAGWRNIGTPYTSATKTVTSALSTTNWTTNGATPYINTDDDDTSYIKSGATVDAEAIFQLDNLAGATGINSAHLSVHWKADSTWWWWVNSECWVYVSRDAGATWSFAFSFGGRNTGWLTYTADLSDFFNQVSYVSGGNARVKFVNKSGSLSTYITYASLAINYSTGGTQDVTDYFQATFNKEDIVGIYVESRADEESFPRNYDVIYVTDVTENYGDFTQTDPNSHIALENGNSNVNFDSYQNEDAYLYKDYGTNNINAFDWKFAFKITTPQNHPRCFVPFVVSNSLDDLKTLEGNGAEYFTALYVSCSSGSLTLAVENQDGGGLGTSTGHSIVAGTTYYLRVIRSGTTLKYLCYSDASLGDAYLLWTETFTLSSSGIRYRYRMQACTYNGLEWATQFINDMSDGFTEWARHGETATVTFPDIGGSESLPPSGKVMQVVADAGEYGYVEEDIDGAKETKTTFYAKVPAPASEAINTNLIVDDWSFVHNDWTHVTGDDGDPWLNDDDAVDYITMAIATSSLGLYDKYYGFGSLDSKYRQIVLSALTLNIKGGIGAHTGGNASVRAYLKWLGQNSWVDAGTVAFDSDVYTVKSLDISGLGIDTINKINTLTVKLEFQGFGGNEDGHVDVTYVYVHIEGTGYMGAIRLAKVYDHDVTAGPDPIVDWCGGVSVELDPDSSSNQDKWRWYVDGFANGGVWNSDYCDSEFPTAGTWYKLRLYTKKASDGTGYFKLYKLVGLVETLLCEYTGLTNNNYGEPDRVCIEAYFGAYNSGTAQLDYVTTSTKGITHTTGYVYAFAPTEVVLASVTGNTYRDIIHSWSPINIGNIQIKITGADAHAWIITQIYIYKAEDEDYRIMHEDASTPAFSLDQYIHAITVDDTYSTPVGPLNITESRVTNQINSVISLLNTAYVPYEWYLELNSNNTFHICDAKGSDKSASISFILGDNLEGSTRENTLEDTFQRVKIKGKGEGSRSEESSSGWINDATAMTSAKTFIEEIKSQKEVVTADTAEILANVELTENADPKDKIECEVSRDEYASMDYDVGDSVLITDSLIAVNSAKRLYNIRKAIDDNGEHITLNVGAPYKDVEETWQEIFSRLKSLEIGGGITGDWTDQVRGSKISVSKLTTLFEKTAKEEQLTTGTSTSDPKWKTTNVGSSGTSFSLGDNGIAMLGVSSGTQVIMTVDYYYNIAVATEEGTVGNDIEYLLTPKQNPKIEFEFNAYEKDSGTPTYWRSGDCFDVGLAKNTATYTTGAWFRFLSIGSSLIEIYAVWRDVGNTSETSRFMSTISTNKRYRFIITYDYDRRWVTWEVWDIANKAKYPLVAVRSNMDISDSQSVHPLFMQLLSNYESGYRAQALIYHVKIEFEQITEEIGESE